jgi:hypothetical protein
VGLGPTLRVAGVAEELAAVGLEAFLQAVRLATARMPTARMSHGVPAFHRCPTVEHIDIGDTFSATHVAVSAT